MNGIPTQSLEGTEAGNQILEGGFMLPPKQKQAYDAFYQTARKNEFLDPKTTLLIHLASAMAFACYP
jgi:hypothetical protein